MRRMTPIGEAPASQWLRGVLDLCLLAVVEREPAYGYEMTKRLTEAGLDGVADGSIYPALARLERAAQVESYRVPSEGGPPRKYYRITASGQAALSNSRTEWTRFVDGVAAVLNQTTKVKP